MIRLGFRLLYIASLYTPFFVSRSPYLVLSDSAFLFHLLLPSMIYSLVSRISEPLLLSIPVSSLCILSLSLSLSLPFSL